MTNYKLISFKGEKSRMWWEATPYKAKVKSEELMKNGWEKVVVFEVNVIERKYMDFGNA